MIAAVKLNRSGLNKKRAVDDFVCRVERHLDFVGTGVDGEGLMLSESGWSEYDREGKAVKDFIPFPLEGFD